MTPSIFSNDAHIEAGGSSSIRVAFSHWSKKALAYTLQWADINSIVAYQGGDSILYLSIFDKDGKEHLLSNQMEGWDSFMDALSVNLPAFDRGLMEKVRGSCFRKVECYWAVAQH